MADCEVAKMVSFRAASCLDGSAVLGMRSVMKLPAFALNTSREISLEQHVIWSAALHCVATIFFVVIFLPFYTQVVCEYPIYIVLRLLNETKKLELTILDLYLSTSGLRHYLSSNSIVFKHHT